MHVPNIASFINKPVSLSEYMTAGEGAAETCEPVKLNLLNVTEKWSCREPVAGRRGPIDRQLYEMRGETFVEYNVSDEELRVDERHPMLPLQVTLFREWCLLNLLDAYDESGTMD